MKCNNEDCREAVAALREVTEQLDNFVSVSIGSPRWHKHRDFRGFCNVAETKVTRARALLARIDANSDDEDA